MHQPPPFPVPTTPGPGADAVQTRPQSSSAREPPRLGLPWIRFVDRFPEELWPWLGAASPLVNVLLLYALHGYARHRR